MPLCMDLEIGKEKMTLYNAIGNNYSQTRKSDPRITAALLEILNVAPPATIVDIGAGTGSYALELAKQGYQVFAVEPSTTMQNQSTFHPLIQWFEGFAENLPLPDQSADAAIIMLAFHHFQNYQKALEEAYRVAGGGQLVVLTYDPDCISRFWSTRYFPGLISDVQSTFLPIAELTSAIETITNASVKVIPFPLPHDLIDAFAAVGWARPELYLDSRIRNGISTFAKLDQVALNDGLSRLQQDIETGTWDEDFGYLRQQQQYDAGYRFVYTVANTTCSLSPAISVLTDYNSRTSNLRSIAAKIVHYANSLVYSNPWGWSLFSNKSRWAIHAV
jgi:ubiquinone/menaquinone biosynthesis C-methylase UbiE